MFSVMFEVYPKSAQWDSYLRYAAMLRPELERMDGFVDNIRYRSLTRLGWLLSLSTWRDEKALVRWRTQSMHHEVQEKGRLEILQDYHLRVGQLTRDTQLPIGHSLCEQRLDETETGGATVSIFDAKRAADWVKNATADEVARGLGLIADAKGLAAWDVFESIFMPGDVLLLMCWQNQGAAQAAEDFAHVSGGTRLRRIRVVRDYGMFDRREAPQYYPDAVRSLSAGD